VGVVSRRTQTSSQSFGFADFFDPKNPLWLNIIRGVGIFLNSLFVLTAVIGGLMGTFPFGSVLLGLLMAFVLHISLMLALNLLYNVHALREEVIKSNNFMEKQNALLESMADKSKSD